MKNALVTAVCISPSHSMEKPPVKSIKLLKRIGVEGDAHSGEKVKHLYLAKKTPDKPNLRQVHLIHSELHDELKEKGFSVSAGQMGENITTKGIDLLNLPQNTILKLGDSGIIKITGLREPCHQLNGVEEGLMKAVFGKNKDGELIRKSGFMAVVLETGTVRAGDEIVIELPEEPFLKLTTV